MAIASFIGVRGRRAAVALFLASFAMLAVSAVPLAAGHHARDQSHSLGGGHIKAPLAARREVHGALGSRLLRRAQQAQAARRRREAHSERRRPRRERPPYPQSLPELTHGLASLSHRFERMPDGQPLPPPVPREILVLFDQDQPQSLGGELARIHGLERLSGEPIPLLSARAELMRVRGSRSEEGVLAALRRDPRVRSAQPNQRYLHTGAADQRYLQSGDLGSLPKRSDIAAPIPQWGPLKIALPEAHRQALGRNVLIGVIDSAIDTSHPELRGAIAGSFNAAGREDTVPDFHGTAVAGIIRAHGLVESAAPESRILAARAFRTRDREGGPETTTHILMAAVGWAVKSGAKILNMSFIGAPDPALQQLLQAANKKGIVVVAAAGNGGPTAPPVYPAAYPGVIAVTAIDEADRPYESANRGPYISIAAPGVDILAPIEHSGYAFVSGTSFAAAYVSGIAALLLERDPMLGPEAVARLIAAGAEDLGAVGWDDEFGAGRVNAHTSLKLLFNKIAVKRGD